MLLAHILTHVTQETAHVLQSQIRTDTTPTDATGVNDALYAIARLIAGFVGGALAVGLVIEGYQYMFSDSGSRGVHLKRSLAILIGGALLVILGVTLAPIIAGAIAPGK